MKLSKEDLVINMSTAMWKGKELRFMTREELYEAFDQLGKLYSQLLERNMKDL